MITCTRCKTASPSFKVKIGRTINAIIDENGNIIEELNVEKQEKCFGSVYVCTVCGKEYVKLAPLISHAI